MNASRTLWEVMGYADSFDEARLYGWRGEKVVSEGVSRISDAAFARQWRTIRALTRLFRLLPGVRFAAVCNRVSWQGAPVSSDVDWFIVTEERCVWAIHAFLAAMGKLLQRRPGEYRADRASWCFSYLIDDSALDLSSLRLGREDPCLSLWFSQFLVMVDDGIGKDLWEKNASWVSRDMPLAPRWSSWFTRLRSTVFVRTIIQWVSWGVFFLVRGRWNKKQRADEPTAVVVTPHIAKLQPGDRRRRIRDQYESLCHAHTIEPYPS